MSRLEKSTVTLTFELMTLKLSSVPFGPGNEWMSSVSFKYTYTFWRQVINASQSQSAYDHNYGLAVMLAFDLVTSKSTW